MSIALLSAPTLFNLLPFRELQDEIPAPVSAYLEIHPECLSTMLTIPLLACLEKAGVLENKDLTFIALDAYFGTAMTFVSFKNGLSCVHFATLGGQKHFIERLIEEEMINHLYALDEEENSILYYALLGNHEDLASLIENEPGFLVAKTILDSYNKQSSDKAQTIGSILKRLKEKCSKDFLYAASQNQNFLIEWFEKSWKVQPLHTSCLNKLETVLHVFNLVFEEFQKHSTVVPQDIKSLVEKKYVGISYQFIGHGTFGLVGKILSSIDGKFYALKSPKKCEFNGQVQSYKEDLENESAILEYIKREDPDGRYPIVRKIEDLEGCCDGNPEKFLILELAKGDLKKSIANQNRLNPVSTLTKKVGLQILSGLFFLQKCGIVHADLKPQNILDKGEDQYVIADFGSSFYFSQKRNREIYPCRMQTINYRSPECAVGAEKIRYSYPIDMWSLACILMEIWIGTSLFPLKEGSDCPYFQPNKAEPLEEMHEDLLGPYPRNLEKHRKIIKRARKIAKRIRKNTSPTQSLRTRIFSTQEGPEASNFFDLIEKMLELNPFKRISAQEAIAHPFFANQDVS